MPGRVTVPGRGVEPLCPLGQTGLSRPRIPFRHPGQGWNILPQPRIPDRGPAGRGAPPLDPGMSRRMLAWPAGVPTFRPRAAIRCPNRPRRPALRPRAAIRCPEPAPAPSFPTTGGDSMPEPPPAPSLPTTGGDSMPEPPPAPSFPTTGGDSMPCGPCRHWSRSGPAGWPGEPSAASHRRARTAADDPGPWTRHSCTVSCRVHPIEDPIEGAQTGVGGANVRGGPYRDARSGMTAGTPTTVGWARNCVCWAIRAERSAATLYSGAPIRRTRTMLVWPATPGGEPATMTAISPSLIRPLSVSALSTCLIMSSVWATIGTR